MTEFVTIKGKTGTYQVSKDSCTCNDYKYRKKILVASVNTWRC